MESIPIRVIVTDTSELKLDMEHNKNKMLNMQQNIANVTTTISELKRK